MSIEEVNKSNLKKNQEKRIRIQRLNQWDTSSEKLSLLANPLQS